MQLTAGPLATTWVHMEGFSNEVVNLAMSRSEIQPRDGFYPGWLSNFLRLKNLFIADSFTRTYHSPLHREPSINWCGSEFAIRYEVETLNNEQDQNTSMYVWPNVVDHADEFEKLVIDCDSSIGTSMPKDKAWKMWPLLAFHQTWEKEILQRAMAGEKFDVAAQYYSGALWT